MQKNSIIFDHVSVSFDTQKILNEINLTLNEKRIGVIGANGSGKSSFIRLLNGLIKPSAGQISIDGVSIAKNLAAIRRKVGFTFQNPETQIIMPTVAEDIAFGLKNLKLPAEEVQKRTQQIMEKYGLAQFSDKPARVLSGGQKQILALCGVLVMQPDIIVLDEPSTQLDLRYQQRLKQTLENLEQRLIVTTHHLTLLNNFDRVLVMNNGQIVFDNTPQKAIAYYENLITQMP